MKLHELSLNFELISLISQIYNRNVLAPHRIRSPWIPLGIGEAPLGLQGTDRMIPESGR